MSGAHHPSNEGMSSAVALLASHRPLAYSANLARLTGDVKSSIMLGQLIYWTRVGVDVVTHDGWVFKTREELTEETGLSRREQESSRLSLQAQGFLEVARVGMPPRLCFRVVPQQIGVALAKLLRSEPLQYSLLDIRSNAQHFRALLGRNMGYYKLFSGVAGSITGGVFLSKAFAMQQNAIKASLERFKGSSTSPTLGDDWFHLSAQNWLLETGLTTSQTKAAKQNLCQKNILEEAFQTYPKEKAFLRLNYSKLAIAIKSILECGRLDRTLLVDLGSRQILPKIYQVNSRQKLPSHPEPASEQNLARIYSVDSEQKLASGIDQPSNIGPDPNAAQNSVSCAKNAHPEGRISRSNWAVLTSQLGGFDPPIGRFSRLYAGARELTTNLTTTTRLQACPVDNFCDPPNPLSDPDVVVVLDSSKPKPGIPLFWPDSLGKVEQLECSRLLTNRSDPIEPERRQALIDELSGAMQAKPVKSPVAYFARMLRLEEQTPGGLVLVHAPAVAQARIAKAEHEARVKRALSGHCGGAAASTQQQQDRTTATSPESSGVSTEYAARLAQIKADIKAGAWRGTAGASSSQSSTNGR
jgi:hypothetical protein